MDKSELKRLCSQNPIDMAIKLHELQAQNAMLRRALNNELEQNEQLVDASVREFSEQALLATSEASEKFLNEVRAKVLEDAAGKMKYYVILTSEKANLVLLALADEVRAKNGG